MNQEGALGGNKAAGQQDAFSNRGKASEDMYIKKREMEKLQAMKGQQTSGKDSKK